MDPSINGRLLNWYGVSSLCHTLRRHTRNKTHRNYSSSHRFERLLRVRRSANCFPNSFLTNTLKPLYDFHFISRTDEPALPHKPHDRVRIQNELQMPWSPSSLSILAGRSDLKTQVLWWGEGPQGTGHSKRQKARKWHTVEMGKW